MNFKKLNFIIFSIGKIKIEYGLQLIRRNFAGININILIKRL